MPSKALQSTLPIHLKIWRSTIGRKLIVAITGLMLVAFLAGHLSGNLLVWVGRKAFNDYADFLHGFLHGSGVWVARIGLLVAFILHIAATISLVRDNRRAREPYAFKTRIQAKKSSLIMVWSGLTILAFVIFHLLHFTFRVSYPDSEFVDPDYLRDTGDVRFDAWKMVIIGFNQPLIVLFYLIAIGLLCSHLSHGVQSMFQTLGLRSKKSAGLLRGLSLGYAGLIWIGFSAIPISILIFGFGRAALPN